MVKVILALLNRKNACFSIPLQRLSSGFNWENRLEFCCFASEPRCKAVASTLNCVVLQRFNIAEIIVLTYFGAFL